MPPRIKALLTAVVLGVSLGAQSPLWAWGVRTGFTFEDSSDALAARAAPGAPSKWIAKMKVAPLWLPKLAALIRLAAGVAAIGTAYALTVFLVLRLFRFPDQALAARAAAGGLLLSLLFAVRAVRSGVSPRPILDAAWIVAAIEGTLRGHQFAMGGKKTPT